MDLNAIAHNLVQIKMWEGRLIMGIGSDTDTMSHCTNCHNTSVGVCIACEYCPWCGSDSHWRREGYLCIQCRYDLAQEYVQLERERALALAAKGLWTCDICGGRCVWDSRTYCAYCKHVVYHTQGHSTYCECDICIGYQIPF